MNHKVVALFYFLAVFTPGFSQSVEKELLRIEENWHNAYKFKDTSILKRILADEFININSRGNQFGKHDIIQGLKTDNARYDSIYGYDMKFMHYENSVAVIGKTREIGMRDNKPFDNSYFWTDIFIKKPDGWKCVLAQTNALPRQRIFLARGLSQRDSLLIYETNSILTALTDRDRFSGVLLIAKNGSILYQGAFGMGNKENNILNEFTTSFNLASVTKMFTGVAIGQLAEQKKLSITDPIGKYLPGLPSNLTEGITIHQLLTHTSGLGSFFTNTFHNSNHAAYRDLSDYLNLIREDQPQFKPGSKWAYSNTGYLLLGLIIEKVSGTNYFEYVEQNIFRKAKMHNTGFYESDRPNKGVATAYTKNNRYLNDTLNWSVPVFIGPVKGSPAGGAYASAADMLNFSQALLNNQLLNEQNTKNVIEGKENYGGKESKKKYGYGFANQIVNGKQIIFHDGGANGISTIMDIYPELGYIVIMLSNYDFPAGMGIVDKIRMSITQ